jgi:hypothetical protein
MTTELIISIVAVGAVIACFGVMLLGLMGD